MAISLLSAVMVFFTFSIGVNIVIFISGINFFVVGSGGPMFSVIIVGKALLSVVEVTYLLTLVVVATLLYKDIKVAGRVNQLH